MYSRTKGNTSREYSLTPPPGYDGSRFRKRSDGRDDAFPLYREEPCPVFEKEHTCKSCETCEEKEALRLPCPDGPLDDGDCHTAEPPHIPCNDHEDRSSPVLSFLKGLGTEEILLISLIALLSGSRERSQMETVLILALLLCVS